MDPMRWRCIVEYSVILLRFHLIFSLELLSDRFWGSTMFINDGIGVADYSNFTEEVQNSHFRCSVDVLQVYDAIKIHDSLSAECLGRAQILLCICASVQMTYRPYNFPKGQVKFSESLEYAQPQQTSSLFSPTGSLITMSLMPKIHAPSPC